MPIKVDDGKNKSLEIWRSRYIAQKDIIVNLKKSLQGSEEQSPEEMARKEIFLKILRKMEIFAHKHFCYFFDGFGYGNNEHEESKPTHLEVSPERPPEFILRSILNQLAYDTSVLERAIAQRQSWLADALKLADIIAYRALEPSLGMDNLLEQDANVITYFHKVPEVLIVPYANVALIGIPYSASGKHDMELSSMRDFLSIPHEVGHFVFWRGATFIGRLHVTLRQKILEQGLGSYQNWLEEIFADVYGCLVAGEIMGLSAQDIHLDDLPARLIEDNQEHPAPVIRPYIYTYLLAKLWRNRQQVSIEEDEIRQREEKIFASLLERRWEEIISRRGKPSKFKLRHKSFDNPELRDTEQGRRDLEKIVEIILTLFLDEDRFDPDWGEDMSMQDQDQSTPETLSRNPSQTEKSTLNDKAQKGYFDLEGSARKHSLSISDGKDAPELDEAKLDIVYANFIDKLKTGSTHPLSIDNYEDLFRKAEQTFSTESAETSWAVRLRNSQEENPQEEVPTEEPQPQLPVPLWNIVFNADGWGPGSGDGDANSKGLEDDFE